MDAIDDGLVQGLELRAEAAEDRREKEKHLDGGS